jgi:Predicted redox protein, regulator of disulfide bond formation
MEREINATFGKEEEFFENRIGSEFRYTQATGPYEYLLGALAGCFYRTMKSHADQDLWGKVKIYVGGNKKKEGLTTLELTKMVITAQGVENKEAFEEAVEYAQENCSIYNTIAQVSKMEIEINYV